MFRCCVSIVALVGLMASQLAAVPHAHNGMSAVEQQRHDATPHFHTHEHGDRHHGHGHAHHPASKSPTPGSMQHEHNLRVLLPIDLTEGGHDSTAVFVTARLATLSATTQCHSDSANSPFAVDSLPDKGGLGTVPHTAASWHPPDVVRDGSNTYLTLRNLRI